MRVTIRIAAIGFLVGSLTAMPSYGEDSPWAHLEGYRCEMVANDETSPDRPPFVIFVCQISDGADPISPDSLPSRVLDTPTLDYLLNLVAILDNARDDASRTWHDAVVPTPTP